MAKTAHGAGGTRAGNPLLEADGPPRRTVRPAGTSGPASGPTFTRLLPPSPHRRPLPKESSHRRAEDTAASRGPAPERAPPGCGRRRRGRETRDRKRDASGRGASPAEPRGRVRLEDAPRRGAAGHVAGGGTGSREGRPASREGPGTDVLGPKRADVRVLPRRHTRSNPERRAPRAPPGHPRSDLSLSGSTRTGRRRRRRRRRPRPRRPPAGALGLRDRTRPQTRTGAFSFPHVDPGRPARGGATPRRTRPPHPRRLTLTESSPPGTPRGTEGEALGGGSADEGGSRAGAEEAGGRK